MIRSSWWFFWVVQFVELILTLGSSKDAKEVIFPEMGELSNPVCEHVNFCFTLRFRLASHSDRNHLGGLGIETKMIRPKQTFGFLAFIIHDFLFTLKGKSSWFIDVGDLPFDMKIAVFVLICLRGFLGTPKNQGKSMWIQFFMLFFHCWHVQFHFEELQLLSLCDCKGKYDLQFLHCICFNKFTISHVKSRA